MDRPEWTSVNPKNGDVYLTLTNNSTRTAALADAANPRAYDVTPGGANRNVNGHIIRMARRAATSRPPPSTGTSTCSVRRARRNAANINVSGLTADNDFSSPDGIWFDQSAASAGSRPTTAPTPAPPTA